MADYYVSLRGIPAANVIHFSFTTTTVMSVSEFDPIKAQLDAALDDSIQALVLTWTTPYRVDCMSVTSAFALGYDKDKYCSTPCQMTAYVPYSTSESVAPFTDYGIRPAMALAGTSVENVMALIDRGVTADGTAPTGDGYFIRTTDPLRSVRYYDFQATATSWNDAGALDMFYLDNSDGSGSNTISNTPDVLFYLTGLTSVADVATNTYLPGAVADHVTSYGGALLGGGQMSILRWLEAGATASYGTVVEPCNYTAKFPVASRLVSAYYLGATVLEAYWKSVSAPGEGVFVGEPLARPWGSAEINFGNSTLSIATTWLRPNATYQIEAADSVDGPFSPVQERISYSTYGKHTITIPNATRYVYRLREAP